MSKLLETKWDSFGTVPKVTASKLRDFALRSRRRIEEWGIAIHHESRLQKAISVLGDASEGTFSSADTDLLERLGEAARLSTELYIGTHGVPDKPDATLLAKTQCALGGAELPRDEADHAARNIQFEVYLHGLFQAGRVNILFDERPDLILDYGSEKVGIAAKRLWSLDRAHKQVSKAAEQIEESGMRGIIAINVERYIDGIGVVNSLQDKGVEFNTSVERLHGQLPYIAAKKHVIGLLAVGTAYQWITDAKPKAQLHTSSFTQLIMFTPDDDGGVEEAFSQRFFGDFKQGVQQWMFEHF